MASLQGDDTGLGFGVEGTSTLNVGIVGRSDQGTGVQGRSKIGAGVTGSSQNAEGVSGDSASSHGVRGESASLGHSGVQGVNTNGGAGVGGQSNKGIGVAGESRDGNGVLGQSDNGMGVVGQSGQGNGVSGQSKEANGVLGLAVAATGSGVFGSNTNGREGNGVTGLSEAGFGVFGQTNHRGGEKTLVAGVVGQCNGPGWGVLGLSSDGRAAVAGFSETGDGVLGQTRGNGPAGVHGTNRGGGDGVRGEGNNGIHGVAITSSWLGSGVLGENPVTGGTGVKGIASDGFGVVGLSGPVGVPFNHAGVAGASDRGPGVLGVGVGKEPGVFAMGSPNAVHAWGTISAIATLAGSFIGDVVVLGTLKATSKLFQIDHPLDPANKYLNHASVESSEMKTIYDGVTVLDADGQAVVELPTWFEALNKNVRYQLTAIGGAAPNLHIAEEVSGNRFRIAGGPARLKVCWQVTGVRHDAFARTKPLSVETEKASNERGYYLHAESHGHPGERGIGYARNPDLMRSDCRKS